MHEEHAISREPGTRTGIRIGVALALGGIRAREHARETRGLWGDGGRAASRHDVAPYRFYAGRCHIVPVTAHATLVLVRWPGLE